MRPQSGLQTSKSRALAACIVVALHGLLWLLAWHSGLLAHRRAANDETSMTWIFVRPPEPAPPATDRPEDRPAAPALPRSTQRAAVSESSTTTVTTPLPPRQIDWDANASYHARKAVEDSVAERYRNFGPRKPGPPPEPAVPSLFEAEPDVAGEEAEDIHGDPIVRLSKYCYQELEKRVPTARDYVERDKVLIPKCMFPIGSPEPRGDLFEHLKRDRPLPAPRPGTTAELPERTPQREGGK